MGALATLPPWTTEDDLLLKNAVEAGASLESLAKGAVQFSRKYNVREIHDRWYSLLYDPVISKEAASRMANFELSASPLPSKFSKFGQSNERKVVSVKRKAGTVRTSYYAMRKRTCNHMLTSTDFNFLVDPQNDNYFANGGESLPEDCMPEGATLDHFPNLGPPQYGLQENMMNGGDVPISGVAAHAFYTGVDDTVEDNFPIEPINVPKDEPQTLEDVSLDGAAEELGVPNELDIDNLIRDDNLEDLSLSAFDQINNDPGNLCSEFDENHMFDSPELECGTSFDTLHLSPLPDMPIWRTDEGIQEPDIPCDGLEDSIARGDTYLAELSDSLLNFTGEEELFLMDADGKDGIDKSYYDGLSSLLLDSPIEVGPDRIPEKVEAELLGSPHAYVTNLSVPCLTEVVENAGLQSNAVQVVHKIEFQMPSSASAKDPQFPEQTNGVIFCTLNTRDPEVPSNDDVFLPFDVPPPAFYCPSKSNSKRCYRKVSPSVHDHECRASERGKVLMQLEQKNFVDSHPSSQMLGSRGLLGPVCGSKTQRELPNSHASPTVSRSAVIASGGLGGNNSAAKTTHALVHGNPKTECTNVGLVKHQSSNVTNSSIEKPVIGSNDFRSHLQPNGSIGKHEPDVALPLNGHRLQHAEMGSSNILESELVVNPPKLDEEEQHIESDDDVPYYSDIEAMVLDMDLDPDDHDLYYNEEVSRYEHDETKRAIIRLEQGAHSHVQRAMASHGAFAMLYGRHSKHYIKKPEVLLGRSTAGVHVDIDLSKGGCVNTISRRQAIIKMDKDGSFHIKNVGKSSILVNNKELQSGQSQRLHSNYLIELRGMTFIFETNQSRVKWYLDHITDNF